MLTPLAGRSVIVTGARKGIGKGYREGPGWPDAGIYRGRAAALDRMQSLIELGHSTRQIWTASWC